jgi:nitroimidazol reductase NimA-like FMN-containing flavoprotein (pyridoxamine 5'-phosphate oxidase superfamily)
MTGPDVETYPVTARNRVRRLPKRASYDRAAVHAVLDGALMCTVAYVIEGQPYATPTAYWRDGERLYWHGSAASRMAAAIDGMPVCVTVTQLDGLVLARSAFHHSVNYRSAMVFGRARIVADPAEKHCALRAFIERIYPGRSDSIRPSSDNELKAIALMALDIEDAAAKARTGGPVDDEPDYARPVWAGVVPFATIGGPPIPDERLLVAEAPEHARIFAGAPVHAIMAANARQAATEEEVA